MRTKEPSTYSAFFELFRQAQRVGLPETDHHELVGLFTGGRTRSLRELNHPEYLELLGNLRAFVAQEGGSSDKMRKKLIGILKGCGYIQANGKADMPRIYGWVVKHGYLHKPLMHYTHAELPRLVFQAEQVQVSTVKTMAQ